ncbi:hypothetical protein BT69DRAFT_1277457 [Atractiella rhizophila]|nr:hypothetical protein BT69DRAFT_1277457 [Atractiella rhizophila]
MFISQVDERREGRGDTSNDYVGSFVTLDHSYFDAEIHDLHMRGRRNHRRLCVDEGRE